MEVNDPTGAGCVTWTDEFSGCPDTSSPNQGCPQVKAQVAENLSSNPVGYIQLIHAEVGATIRLKIPNSF
jgi:hypothetical protein